MKRLLLITWLFLLIYSFFDIASAAEVVISGSSQFDCSLSDYYMEKHGYVFIEETYYEDHLSTNIYGAGAAEVIVKNEHGAVLGSGMADKEGRFSITVPKVELYKVIVKFHGRERIKQIQYPRIDNIVVYIGYFKSDEVDSWIRTAARAD